jgi:FMN phosphatase YigB (HAD superfamily)
MIYWIFDMDETLYNFEKGKFSYDQLKKDNELIYLINKLNGRKILFTNASHQHTNIVLDKLGLVSSFDLILDRDTLGVLKPHPLAFIKLIKWCSITERDTCYFFEDTINNLIMGNIIGWQSVLINPKANNEINKKMDFIFLDKNKNIPIKKTIAVNYVFKNIKTALKHFHSRIE